MKRVKLQTAFIGTMAIALSASILLGSYTNDRIYSLGDDQFETQGTSDNHVQAGDLVGFTTSVETGEREVTFDSEFDVGYPTFFDAQDLEAKDIANGRPTYVDVSGRPAATFSGSSLGVQFDGVNDRLEATAFNRADWYWDQPDFGDPTVYPRNYEGIRGRGAQLWIKPTNVNGTRQDVFLDSSEFGGVVITENNKWGLAFDMDHTNLALGNGGIFESTADVQQGQWVHAMVVNDNGGGSPILYINGIAVAAAPGYAFDEAPLTDPNDADSGLAEAPQPLFIGASDLWGNGYENFFQGEVDDIQMFLWGNNSSQTGPPEGQDWGAYDFLTDNEYAAWQISQSQGIGDLNLDGVLNQDDIDIFGSNWQDKSTKTFSGLEAYDLESYQMGDLNGDGKVSLLDWAILRQAFVDDGQPAPAFNPNNVPEPATMLLLGLGGLAMLRRRK